MARSESLAPISDGVRDATWDVVSERINDIVILADPEGVIFYASPAVKLLGYRQDEMIGRSGADFVHPDDLSRFIANTESLLKPGGPGAHAEREHRFRRADGSFVWLEGNPSLLPGEAGKSAGILNVFRDVSERRAVREALAESERRYRLVAENATDMISITAAADGRLTYLSPSVERVTGYAVGELLNGQMREHVHPDDLKGFLRAFADLLADRRAPAPIRFRAAHKDGRWMWLESNPRVVRDADGQPMEIVDVTREVTEAERLKDQLHAALAQAEHAAAAKGDFLANMSHEIRTPLTAVLGFTGLLAERADLDPQARAYVARISGASRALLAVVNDVLDYSKLEAGEVTIRQRPTSVGEAGREVLEMFGLQAEAKGLALKFTTTPSLPPSLSLDEDRLRQILTNLVGNAVKFTGSGEVSLKLDYDPAGCLVAEVADTGPGVSPQDRARLFQRFSQLDGSSTRSKGGTGLGLAICLGLAEAMGGTLTMESDIGVGSLFTLRIPALRAGFISPDETSGAVVSLEPLSRARILVVDDNPVNRELACAILAPQGVELAEARHGQEAVKIADELPFDVILMDLRMPLMDGRAALAAIRAGGGPNRRMPVLAFSADGMMDLDQALDCGFQGMVRKPIVPEELLSAVARVLDPQDDVEVSSSGGAVGDAA